MQKLAGKNILLGITGGIAAYKTPELVRRIKDHGANVRVVMTDSAKAFVSPLSLQAVSANAVSDSLLDKEAELAMGHIELAKWADQIVIAPASANTMANIAHGMASDLLTTIVLATTAPIAIVPAMNQQMWHTAVTQQNVERLQALGFSLWGPGQGEQACGDVGFGRMIEVEDIVERLCATQEQPLLGQHWVITAGPTREAIDPVRYISNHSSGKMGYAIAAQAVAAGASVSLISGPVNLAPPQGCELIAVESAQQMHQAALTLAPKANVFVACAAVADYRLAKVADQKMKKTPGQDELTLTLVKNPDIVADVAKLADKPFTVGFAAETQDVEQYAKDKLARKGLDLIAANNVAIEGQGFNSDQNALTVYSANNAFDLPLGNKSAVAKQLIEIIARHFDES
ncbi:bifunctional phosphopantothenoylcysteine decarboxylase/phosphopantothenate--cysteine ligase CoaBC [Thalassotalea marina]|uniref:Coenzyme A biosynthesis bifunctional protein CoaBC n=1 Tax=Thalassotalea marina TaxID=1673741 RepID=A0A919BGC3_9GAMM|nr:bifunctional phosphopantothenoylcysteine decarboxylase/phosphopantothenate--cysteine ligase CoaBC [Thalassotalea marina]GHF89180.1 phosphopantothenoylcysteine decarboxylase [Thalassotalea marina]